MTGGERPHLHGVGQLALHELALVHLLVQRAWARERALCNGAAAACMTGGSDSRKCSHACKMPRLW